MAKKPFRPFRRPPSKKNEPHPLVWYWSRQICRTGPEPWRRRLLVKRRLPPPSTLVHLTGLDLIYREIHLPRLLKFERLIKTITYDQFRKLTPPDRARVVKLFSFSERHQHLLERAVSQTKIVSTADLTSRDPVLKVKLRMPSVDFDSFAQAFVKGGLSLYKPLRSYQSGPHGRPYYEGGTPDPVERVEVRKKKLTRRFARKKKRPSSKVKKVFLKFQLKNRHRYRPNVFLRMPVWVAKKRALVLRSAASPRSLDKFKRFARLFKRETFYPAESFFLTTDLKVSVAHLVKNFRRVYRRIRPLKLIPPPTSVPRPLLTRRVSLRQRHQLRRAMWFYNSVGARSRWKHVFKPVRQIDPVRTRWDWSTRYKGSFASGREFFLSADLVRGLNFPQHLSLRTKVLTRQRYQVGVATARIRHLLHHQRLIEQPLPRARKIRLDRRRYYQRRLLRLRRMVESRCSLKGYYLGGTAKTFAAYKVNRFNRMELNDVVRKESFIKFLTTEESYRRVYSARFTFPMYYNLFRRRAYHHYMRRSWRYDHDRRHITKSGQLRMKPLVQHPSWGEYFRTSRRRRLDFLRRTLITKFSNRRTLNSYDGVPHRDGFEASVYAQKVDTRRKLDGPPVEGRSLMSFCRAFLGGFVVEKHQKKIFPTTIGNHSSFNRASLNLEVKLSPGDPTLREEYVRHTEEADLLEPEGHPPPAPSWWLIFARPLWFYLFTPLWWVYYVVAKFYCRLARRVRHFLEDFWLFFKHVFKLPFRIIYFCVTRPFRHLNRFLRANRLVRILTWIYTSWLYVDLLENNQREQDYGSIEEQDQFNQRAEGDIDPDDDRADVEEDAAEGMGYNASNKFFGLFTPYYHGNPAWEWYLQNFPDEEVSEVFEEASYFSRLILRPFVDFIVFLPIWSFLELISLWLEAVKGEYQRWWLKTLLRGNSPGKIRGRWWKIPLVGLKVSFRLAAWGIFTLWLVNHISSEDLKIIVTYDLGSPWFEEYYYLYIAVCLVGSTFLLGPPSVRDFFFHELGFENLAYIFVVPASLARPESYQPQRDSFRTFKYLTRWDLQFGEKEDHPYSDKFNGRWTSGDKPNQIVSYDDIRIVLSQFHEYEITPSSYGENDTLSVDRHDALTEEKFIFNFSERHPVHVRNEWHRHPVYGWQNQFTLLSRGLPGGDHRYQSALTSDQYWNRTIVHRQEYPQNIATSFKSPAPGRPGD